MKHTKENDIKNQIKKVCFKKVENSIVYFECQIGDRRLDIFSGPSKDLGEVAALIYDHKDNNLYIKNNIEDLDKYLKKVGVSTEDRAEIVKHFAKKEFRPVNEIDDMFGISAGIYPPKFEFKRDNRKRI